MIIPLPYQYIRDCALKIFAKALLLYFVLNAFVVQRFALEPFTLFEVICYSTTYFIFTHDIRIAMIADNTKEANLIMRFAYSMFVTMFMGGNNPKNTGKPDDQSL